MDSHIKPLALTPWWKSGLFWHTFILLAFLISVSMGAWVISFRMVEREPVAQRAANQLVSVVTITRAALMHSAPDLRRELLFDLASNEGIRIYVHESTDDVERFPETDKWYVLQPILQRRLGADTIVSKRVNGIDGFWVSFKIDEEDDYVYWLALPQERFDGAANWQWLWWAAAGFGLSLMGAGFISGLINRPLAKLALAARTLARGQKPDHLPMYGSAEVKDANSSFNQMVSDLERIDLERTEVLAGISHDLRTPLTRIQLELEMSCLPEEDKKGIESDIRQMDAIIEQFLDYARLRSAVPVETINISALVEKAAAEASRHSDVVIESKVDKDLYVRGNHTDFERVLNNIFSNAERYGRTPGSNTACINVRCKKARDEVVVEIADRGQGISREDRERLIRPFTRLDSARSQANGSGLGLAIINRLVNRYGGRFELKDNSGAGLLVSITFPLTLPPEKK